MLRQISGLVLKTGMSREKNVELNEFTKGEYVIKYIKARQISWIGHI